MEKYTPIEIPTYEPGKAEALPLFFEKRPYQGASGKIYPLPFVSGIGDEKKAKRYKAAVLENEYLHVEILPELGGKIYRAQDKTNGYDFVYYNKVIKPAMVGLCGPWSSGGIEFNWPQHHRPTTFMPLESDITFENGEKTVWVGETEAMNRMRATVGFSTPAGCSYIKAQVRLFNRTPYPQPFMWWANLAAPVSAGYKVVFPPDTEYVNDHDRRAVLSWPIAKGVYHTARPFDYGDGKDIHEFSGVTVPSSFMISRGQSAGDFVSGYDTRKGCGVVAVSDHHVCPGKKLWTWGDSAFGDKWCSNLTDDGSRYIELMTGAYTDNQPDFTWIMPYETKCFEQYWFPIRGIGEVKQANKYGALSLEVADGLLKIGVCATSERKGCRISLRKEGKELYSAAADIGPRSPFTASMPYSAGEAGLEASVRTQDGAELLRYTVRERGRKKPVAVRKPALPPAQLRTAEELYLNGLHLEQYKHFSYAPEDYYEEGLRRDPGDSRCNAAMGRLCLKRGEFSRAIEYFGRALERLECRNCNPYDTDALYAKAVAERLAGMDETAYDDFYASVWSYSNRSAGYYALAALESKAGNPAAAVEFLRLSLQTDSENLLALYMLSVLTGDDRLAEEVRKRDCLFLSEPHRAEIAADFAIEFEKFGLYRRAYDVLKAAEATPINLYRLAHVCRLLGRSEEREQWLAKASSADWAYCFPNRLEDIAVLSEADGRAQYYLGCLYYDKERWQDAAAAWEKCLEGEDLAPAHRNLALAYFDHLGRAEEAKYHMERAFSLMPESSRVFYETAQLYKNLNLPLAERLGFYRAHAEMTAARDDATLEYSVLLCLSGDPDGAERVLLQHRFHTYEGGEGYLTQHHAWLHFLQGCRRLSEGDTAKAEAAFESGLTFPLCYGEEKNYFVNDAPLYYGLMLCAARRGDAAAFAERSALADSTKGSPTLHSYWQALAQREAGRDSRAAEVLAAMKAEAESILADAKTPCYYGVGATTYQPFRYDVEKVNVLKGKALLAFAEFGLGNVSAADAAIGEIEELDRCDFSVFLYRNILKKGMEEQR